MKGKILQKTPTRESLHLAFLVTSAKLGDQDALQALARRCHGKFLAHGWRLAGDKDAAQDIVQQAWTEILRGLPKLKDDHMFLPWGYRIVTRMTARWVKRQQKRRLLASAVENEVAAETEADDADARITLEQAIARLPPKQRATLALFYRESLSIAEISVALDVPTGTVKSRLSHAREKLRSILERE